MKKITARSIDEYIALQPEEFAATLKKLRSIIKSVVPKAEETISYQVACFRHIYLLVGIGVSKEYCSLYNMSPPLVKRLKKELEGVKLSGTTLHFTPGKPLPVGLIKRIVRARVQENEDRSSSRNPRRRRVSSERTR